MNDTAFVTKLAEMARVPAAELGDATPIDPEAWDSVDVLDLIAAIDASFGTTVPLTSLNSCRTVGELRNLIRVSASAS